MAPSSSLPLAEVAEEEEEEDILLPQYQIEKELAALDDDDDDDDEEEEEDDEPYLGPSLSATVLADPPQLQHQDHNIISSLEEHLSKVTLEWTTIRNERDKQRLQLDALTRDHQALMNQKELRMERVKLQEQLEELQRHIDTKTISRNQQQVEGLEQVKSHFRQLQRTLQLLQAGVEEILEQSACDTSTSLEGRNRAIMRQALLKQLLQQDWKKSHLSLYHDEILDDYDDDDDDDEDGHLFYKKNKRYNSIDSMISEIASLPSPPLQQEDDDDKITRSGGSARVRRVPSTTITSSEGRSLSRSKFYQIEDKEQQQQQQQQQQESPQRRRSLLRSHSTSSQGSTGSGGGLLLLRRKRSKSSSSSGGRRSPGLRRTRSFDAVSLNASSTTSISNSGSGSGTMSRRKTSLMRMLDQDAQQQQGDEEGSQDTPKTTNTQGTR